MADIRRQNAKSHAGFDAAIAAKQDRERQERLDRLERAVPKWLAFLLKPLLRSLWNGRQRGFQQQGQGGEKILVGALRWRLDRRFTLCPDVVIQVGPDQFAQLDLVVVGISSVFILEVKTWTGAIRATGTRWQRRVGNRWQTTESPVRQQQMHVHRFAQWLIQHHLPINSAHVFAAIAMMNVQWLRTRDVPLSVFDRPSAVARWIQTLDKARTPMDSAIRAALLEALVAGDSPAPLGAGP